MFHFLFAGWRKPSFWVTFHVRRNVGGETPSTVVIATVVVMATIQLHSTEPELRFYTGSNPDRDVPEIVRMSRWWGCLTMVPAGNKAKRFSSVNHTTKTIHHHHHHHRHHHHHIWVLLLQDLWKDVFMGKETQEKGRNRGKLHNNI